jgi:broad specificity phosphatase PhoE
MVVIMGVMYFIRHGQRCFGSDDDDRLSAKGIRQAEILGDYFQRLELIFDAAYAGALERQQATARIVLSRLSPAQGALELRIAPEFNEFDPSGILASQLPEMLREDPSLAQAVERLYTDPGCFRRVFDRAMLRYVAAHRSTPETNKLHLFMRSVHGALDALIRAHGPGGNIVVFTSGGTLSAVMQAALHFSEEMTLNLAWQIPNTAVSSFDYCTDGLRLRMFNSTAHLDMLREPGLLTYF